MMTPKSNSLIKEKTNPKNNKILCMLLTGLMLISYLLLFGKTFLTPQPVQAEEPVPYCIIWEDEEESDTRTGYYFDADGERVSMRFLKWDSTDSLPTMGDYYLANDVVIEQSYAIDRSLSLCLNGHGITQTANDAAYILSSSILDLYDISNSDKSINSTCTGNECALIRGSGSTVHLYSGKLGQCFSGISLFNYSTCKMYGGTISTRNIGIACSYSHCYIYGGKIAGENKGIDCVGSVCNIYDGSITQSAAGINCVSSGLVMRGGSITQCSNGIILDDSTLELQSGLISKNGKGVYVGGDSNFRMIGGTISDNYGRTDNVNPSVTEDVNNVYIEQGASGFTKSGGKINGGIKNKLPGYAVITFHSNYGTDAKDIQYIPTNNNTALQANWFTRENSTFAAWNTASDGTGVNYADRASINTEADLDLYAKWSKAAVTVNTYDLTGGQVNAEWKVALDNGDYASSCNDIYDVDTKHTVRLEQIPSGYKFYGWAKKSAADAATVNVNTDIVSTDLNYTFTVTHDIDYLGVYEAYYKILDGNDQTFRLDEGSDVVIRANEDLACLTGVKVDGAHIRKDIDYTTASGSTIVTLKNAYLKTLAAGNHTVTFVYDRGYLDTVLKIQAAAATTTSTTATTSTPVVTSSSTTEVTTTTAAANAATSKADTLEDAAKSSATAPKTGDTAGVIEVLVLMLTALGCAVSIGAGALRNSKS